MPYQSKVPYPRRPWGYNGVDQFNPTEAEMRLMLPGSRAECARRRLPNAFRLIGRNKYPYWHSFNYDLQSQTSDNSAIVPQNNFVALSFVGSVSAAAGARAQSFQMGSDNAGLKDSRVPVNVANQFGTAQLPYFVRRPMPLPDGRPRLNRCVNLATAENVIQMCIFGCRDKQAGMP